MYTYNDMYHCCTFILNTNCLVVMCGICILKKLLKCILIDIFTKSITVFLITGNKLSHEQTDLMYVIKII